VAGVWLEIGVAASEKEATGNRSGERIDHHRGDDNVEGK